VSQGDEIEARVAADIAQHGWHVVLVPPEGNTPGWAHSIGLQESFGHPEIVVFGMDLEVLGPLLNRLGEAIRAGERFEADCERDGILQGLSVSFRPVDARWIPTFLGNAAWHYQRQDVAVLQVFWPDASGRFPWDPDSDAVWRQDQPLLHHRETHLALSEALVAVLQREGAL